MALKDKATLVVGTGHFYTANVDTAYPTTPDTPGAGWEEIGHTSIEDIISFDSEGGEASPLGTLQNPNLRTTYSTRTESFNIILQQFDPESMKLFYGSNANVSETTGLLEVPTNPIPTTVAFLAVFKDGNQYFTIYVPKAEIFRGDNFEIADTESLASMPLAIKPLQSGSNAYTYAVSPIITV